MKKILLAILVHLIVILPLSMKANNAAAEVYEKKIDGIEFESSDLEADPAQYNVVNLNALLRNHASYTLSYPDLELTFIDAQDKPLARRTFRPVEYIQPNEDEKQGLAANHELHVKLKIDTTDLKPSGYRLFLFYPNKKQVEPSLDAEKIKLFRPQPLPTLAGNQWVKPETQQNNSSALSKEINEASSKLGLPPIYSRADFIKYFGRCDNDDAKTLGILRESMNAKTISTCVSLNDSACSNYVGVGQCAMIRAGFDNDEKLAFIMMTAKGERSAFKPQLDFRSYGDGGSKYSTSDDHGELIQIIKSRWLANKNKTPLSIEVTSMNSTSGQLSVTTIAPQHQ